MVWSRSFLPQNVPRQGQSLAMSAAEAADVFHRARGRTLDAFSSGTTAWLFAWDGGLQSRNLPRGEPSGRGRSLPSGLLRGLHRHRGGGGSGVVGVGGRFFAGLDLTLQTTN